MEELAIPPHQPPQHAVSGEAAADMVQKYPLSEPTSLQFSWPFLYAHTLDVAALAIKSSFQTRIRSKRERIAPATQLILLAQTIMWSPLAARETGLGMGITLILPTLHVCHSNG